MTEYFNPFSLKGKKILVTGASSGIGRATAIVCSKMGAELIITGRDEQRLQETLSSMDGSTHTPIIADIATDIGRSSLVDEVDAIDGVVHCAGISGHKVFQFLNKKEIKEMFDINFNTPLLLSQDLIKKRKIKNGGSIVFITSTSGIISSYIGGSLYSSTKGALNGLIKGMALELATRKIRVNSVMPSMVRTPIMNGGQLTEDQFNEDSRRYPLKRYGYPEEVAYAVVYLLSDASAWTTGTNLLLDGGLSIAY